MSAFFLPLTVRGKYIPRFLYPLRRPAFFFFFFIRCICGSVPANYLALCSLAAVPWGAGTGSCRWRRRARVSLGSAFSALAFAAMFAGSARYSSILVDEVQEDITVISGGIAQIDQGYIVSAEVACSKKRWKENRRFSAVMSLFGITAVQVFPQRGNNLFASEYL